MTGVIVKKHLGNWFVSGIEGMTRQELDSVLDKITHEQGFEPDLKVDISTGHGTFSCPGADLTNDSMRQNLFAQGGANV